MAKKNNAATMPGTVEERILALLNSNADVSRPRNHIARNLRCTVDEVRAPLDALLQKGLISCSSVGTNRVYFAKRQREERAVIRVAGKGELKGDYNGAQRHWSLCMEVRR